MNQQNTFILLSRSILDSDVFASPKMLKIWIWCLCRANFKDRAVPVNIGKGESIVHLKRGQFIYGRHQAQEALCIEGTTVDRWMKKLQDMGSIKIEPHSHYSIITVCNYDIYQNPDTYKRAGISQQSNNHTTANAQQNNRERTDDKQQKHTDNKVKNVNIGKNANNVNNDKNVKMPFEGDDFRQAWQNWKTYKREEFDFKFKGSVSEQSSLTKLQNLSGNNKDIAIKIIDQSISNGYKGLFELKENVKQKHKNYDKKTRKHNRVATGKEIAQDNR